MNYTIVVPEGSTNHGSPNMICTPPQWYDYVIFYLANYVAHAATVITGPGQGRLHTIIIVVCALVLPVGSVMNATEAILRCAVLTRNPLRRAARAKALYMVSKDDRLGRSDPESQLTPVDPKHVPNAGVEDKSTFVDEQGGLLSEMQGKSNGDSETMQEMKDRGAGELNTKDKKHHEGMEEGEFSSTDIGLPMVDRMETETPGNNTNPSRPDTISKATKFAKSGPCLGNHHLAAGGDTPLNVIASSDQTPQWWNLSIRGLPYGTTVHGKYSLPPGYRLTMVPYNAPLKFAVMRQVPESLENTFTQKDAVLASSTNVPKLLASLAQAIWATTTLYRTRGDQIDHYGYAAFGLTVAQYAFMSITNIIANLLTPEYPAVFLIRTPLMDEAEKVGGFFIGEICIDLTEIHSKPQINPTIWIIKQISPISRILWTRIPLMYIDDIDNALLMASVWVGETLGLIPLAIVGGLSNFHARNSTRTERGFTMAWLVISIVFGMITTLVHPFLGYFEDFKLRDKIKNFKSTMNVHELNLVEPVMILVFGAIFYIACFTTTFIGGMVVVGKMIKDFGICTAF